MHPPSLFSPSTSHCFSRCLLVHRQAVCAEAGTMSSPTNPEVKELNPVDFIQLQQYIECEYRQAGRQAAFSALNTPPSTSTSTHTHSFTLAHGFSYLEEVAVYHILFFCKLSMHIYIYIVVLQINLYLWCNHIHRWHLEVWIKNVCTQSRMDEVCVRIPVWPACLCFQTTTWRWKMCWGNSMQMAVWPGTGMERWGDRVSCCSQSNPSLQN